MELGLYDDYDDVVVVGVTLHLMDVILAIQYSCSNITAHEICQSLPLSFLDKYA
jgi:hypothetical protein